MAKKSPMSLLIAMGGPKSQNSSGMPSSSEASPDQSTDALAEDMPDEPVSQLKEKPSYMLPVPAGFKAPSAAAGDGIFTTTIRTKIVTGKDGEKMFDIQAVGDMPVHSEEGETPAEEESESPEEESSEDEGDDTGYKKQKADMDKAQKAFQPSK